MRPEATTADVIVVGAGTIGTAIGWRCAQSGLSVVIVDPDPQRGAWRTAAGMLAPVTELHYAETPLLRLNQASLERYPDFADELTAATGKPTGFRACGTIGLAWDAADLAALRDVHAFSVTQGVGSTMLDGRELRELEPPLAAGVPGGLLAPDDHQVEPRLLHSALAAAADGAGVQRVNSLARIDTRGDRVVGITTDDGTTLRSGVVVLAAGAWSATIAGLPAHAMPDVRPVQGQTLRLRLPGEPRLRRVIRATVRGTLIYLVPRADGRVVLGASSDEVGFDTAARAGALHDLLRHALLVLPEVAEAEIEEISVGLRPGSPDNAPLIGHSGLDGLVHATGHYRNGILLTPITADGVASLIITGRAPEMLAPFAPTRFSEVTTR